MLESKVFICLATLIVFSSMMVISTKNPVHSVLFLILTFIIAAGLLLLLEIEFISLIFIVIYVGAIAVLFLFVVMMLDIKISESKHDFLKYFPIGSFFGIAFLIETSMVLVKDFESNSCFESNNLYENWFNSIDYVTDVETLGQIIYTHFFVYFLVAGIILLVSMIGAIVLTLTFRKNWKKQIIYKQIARNFNEAIFLTDANR